MSIGISAQKIIVSEDRRFDLLLRHAEGLPRRRVVQDRPLPFMADDPQLAAVGADPADGNAFIQKIQKILRCPIIMVYVQKKHFKSFLL